MSTPARIRRALNALEMRRVAIERQIIADMERKFFSTPEAIVSVTATSVLRSPGVTLGPVAGHTTNSSQFTMTWLV